MLIVQVMGIEAKAFSLRLAHKKLLSGGSIIVQISANITTIEIGRAIIVDQWPYHVWGKCKYESMYNVKQDI